MSFFLSPTALIPALAGSHSSRPPLNQQHATRTTLSPRSLIGTVGRLVRDPATAIGQLVDVPWSGPLTSSDTKKSILRLQLQSAESLDAWRSAAGQLDELEGNDSWKEEPVSSDYNYELIQARLSELEEARTGCDAARMLFLIRTTLTRNLGGMGGTALYSHSRIGTKRLIEHYISSALATLKSLLDITSRHHNADMDSRHLLQQVLKARQSFGRSALLLSGGGTFGMSHIGVAKCLWENKLLPRIISGASAGSIVCAVLCTRSDDEMPAILSEFCYGELRVFTREGVDDGIMQQVARFLKTGTLFDIGNLTSVMRDLLGDMTFQEAYNRTRRILNICVSSASMFELPMLLNYVTAPNVLIWSAVAASCSVPLIYSPAGLLAKDPKTNESVPWNPMPQRWIDGSVENDLPMTRLAEMFNVNHFIVSQVNPHVVPFLAKEEGNFDMEFAQHDSAIDTGSKWLNLLASFAKDEAMHRLHVLSELGVLSTLLTKTRSVLSQKYSGDITIFPEISYSQFHKVLQNPTTEFMLQASLHGQRATWPKLSRIQNHCAIELALDSTIQELRARIAFSPSQVNLRLNAIARSTLRLGSEVPGTKINHQRGRQSRYSTGGITRRLRRASSSESDPQLLTFAPAQSPRYPRSTIERNAPATFHLDNTNEDLLYGLETGEEFSLSSSDLDEHDPNEARDHWHDSGFEAPEAMVSGIKSFDPHHVPLSLSRPTLPVAKTHLSSKFAKSTVRDAELETTTTTCPALLNSTSRLPWVSCTPDITEHSGQSWNARTTRPLLSLDIAGMVPGVSMQRRSMSTGRRWLRPPSDNR